MRTRSQRTGGGPSPHTTAGAGVKHQGVGKQHTGNPPANRYYIVPLVARCLFPSNLPRAFHRVYTREGISALGSLPLSAFG